MTATTDTSSTEADRALKAKHRSVWASGDYPTLAQDLIWTLGPTLVEARAVPSGQLVLDVAAGSGNVAIPAAERGANVVASDLTPELFDAGRRIAAERGVEIDWREADAEALPFPDSAFDAVLSCVGVMFAPHHKDSADELVRVLRPGGTLGLLSWTPQGFIGQLFATMKPFSPPPPAGAQPPPLWGNEEHVRALLGDRVTEVSASKASLVVDEFATPAAFRDYFKANYGPTIAVYRAIADEKELVAALDRELEQLARRFDRGTSGSPVLDWEYLLLTCERA